MACPSFLPRNQHPLIEASLINCPTDPAERIEPSLPRPTLVEEVPHHPFDQFIGALVAAPGDLQFDLLFQVRR